MAQVTVTYPHPETLIRLARWRDRLVVGCMAASLSFAPLAFVGIYSLYALT